MSAPQPPTDPDPRRDTAVAVAQPPSESSPAQPPAPRKRPWGWIAVAGLLAAGVVALAIYAVNLNSDLDDANARIASQQDQIDQTQDVGADVVAAAKGAYDNLSAQLGATQEDASQAAEEAAARLDQAEQAAAEAQGTAEEVQMQADAAQAKAEAAATCAQSFLSACSGVFSGATLREGVEATVAELQGLQPQCATALSGSGA